jgi:hypothetical protein
MDPHLQCKVDTHRKLHLSLREIQDRGGVWGILRRYVVYRDGM